MRDHFYKAGAEAIGDLIGKHPHLLQNILVFIDRNLDSFDEVGNFSRLQIRTLIYFYIDF